MTRVEIKNERNTLNEVKLMQAFVEHATAHRELYVKSDIKGSNRAHDKLIKLAMQFRQLADRGERMLRELVFSNHESVRKWAAYFLLPIDEKLAIKTLNKLAKTTQSASMKTGAEVTVEEWRAGRIDVDWFVKKTKVIIE